MPQDRRSQSTRAHRAAAALPTDTYPDGHFPSGRWVLVELYATDTAPLRYGTAWLRRYRGDVPQLAKSQHPVQGTAPLHPDRGRILSAHFEKRIAAARAEILNAEPDPAARARLIVEPQPAIRRVESVGGAA